MYLAGTCQMHWIYFTYRQILEQGSHKVTIKWRFGLELCKMDVQGSRLSNTSAFCIAKVPTNQTI